MIFPHLERLTRKGWWTVGSQPAINGARSDDEVVGWGPRNGYVYQKCFVEFFAERGDVEGIVRRVEEEGAGWVDYFAGNLQVGVFFWFWFWFWFSLLVVWDWLRYWTRARARAWEEGALLILDDFFLSLLFIYLGGSGERRLMNDGLRRANAGRTLRKAVGTQ